MSTPVIDFVLCIMTQGMIVSNFLLYVVVQEVPTAVERRRIE